VPTWLTPGDMGAAQADIATVKARTGKYFTLPPFNALTAEPGFFRVTRKS
jgi:hypothetical protein